MLNLKLRNATNILFWFTQFLFICSLIVIGLWFIGKGSAIIGSERVFTLFDDAMISMTYGRNLAEGHGLVWNAGEPAVEGYTNPLWTVWIAILHLTGFPDAKMGFLVSLSGLIILVSNLFIVAQLTKKIIKDSKLAILTSVSLTTFCFPLIFWTLRGMEVGLLVLLANLTFLTLFIFDEKPANPPVIRLIILLSALVLTRMDSILIIVPLLYYGFSGSSKSTRNKIWVSCFWGGIGTLVVLTVFRKFYYGDWLPNTYYLKLTGVSVATRWHRGLESLYATVTTYLGLPILLVASATLFLRKVERSHMALLFFFFLQCLYSVYVGGDAWEWSGIVNRYISISLPALFILCGWVVGRLSHGIGSQNRIPKTSYFALSLGILGVNLFLHGQDMRRVFWERSFEVERDFNQSAIGLYFRRSVPFKASAGVFSAGSFCYFSRLRCIDFLGKSDKHIARLSPKWAFTPGHNKVDFNYTIGILKPDVIIGLYSEEALKDFFNEQRGTFKYIAMNESIWLNQRLHWPNALFNCCKICCETFSDDVLEAVVRVKQNLEQIKLFGYLKVRFNQFLSLPSKGFLLRRNLS